MIANMMKKLYTWLEKSLAASGSFKPTIQSNFGISTGTATARMNEIGHIKYDIIPFQESGTVITRVNLRIG